MRRIMFIAIIALAACGSADNDQRLSSYPRCQEDEFRLNGGECQTVDDNPNIAIRNAAASMGPFCLVGRVAVKTEHGELIGYCIHGRGQA